MGQPKKYVSKKCVELNDINSKEIKKTQLKSTRTKKITKKKVQLMIPSQINNFSVSNLETSNRLLVRKIKRVSEDERSFIINESEKIEDLKVKKKKINTVNLDYLYHRPIKININLGLNNQDLR